MIFSPLIWKKHKHRDDFKECPHCRAPLRWIYDGFDWLPCDKEPVLFRMHPEGKSTVVYKRAELTNCILYSTKDTKGAGEPLWGHVQHYYTCPVLKERRREYIQQLNKIKR